jgi:hypothetical protein
LVVYDDVSNLVVYDAVCNLVVYVGLKEYTWPDISVTGYLIFLFLWKFGWPGGICVGAICARI